MKRKRQSAPAQGKALIRNGKSTLGPTDPCKKMKNGPYKGGKDSNHTRKGPKRTKRRRSMQKGVLKNVGIPQASNEPEGPWGRRTPADKSLTIKNFPAKNRGSEKIEKGVDLKNVVAQRVNGSRDPPPVNGGPRKTEGNQGPKHYGGKRCGQGQKRNREASEKELRRSLIEKLVRTPQNN